MGYRVAAEIGRVEMFATKKALERHIASTEYALTNLEDRYWSLWIRHELLLKHFGLSEHTTPETRELRAGPKPRRLRRTKNGLPR